ncbi:hypothetical protein [Methanobrevibacter arboriphilus]|uniref:hypothetical protein n=1 Tax=Methanobrevibacter arboriphilus TaxID=39441 RepID=UPI000ACFB28D|nr:hypothetical protein [Methanobrevibacter arboriphilus]
MRKRIANELGVELYDIYGLTEIYGPGIGISCEYESGMHLWMIISILKSLIRKQGKFSQMEKWVS